jgi:serine/threonine protein kinase/N-acetylneuraminic acid mutarotase
MTESAPKLFISYRREETFSHAGRLYDRLAARFGERNVFMDLEIEPGIDFVDRIVEVVGACQVFLVVVGPTWATLSNGGSRPRLADREDYVRLEVETALRRRNVRVIPLLVAGAHMPQSHELPEELRSLTRRNALELSDVRWRFDVDRLIVTLEGLLETGALPVLAGSKAIEAPRAPAGVEVGTVEGSRPENKVGAEIAGHRLEAIIGQSRTGCVYRARDLQLDRVVALKVIAPEFAEEPEFRQRFKRESRQAASIRHPNVVSIYRAGEQGDLLFLTRDYVEGINLKTFIGIRGRLEPGLAARVASQVAAGLEAGHARGLVYSDVSPGNVLIDGQEQAYLLTNFGLAKSAGTGSALTTDYLAPEQIRGDKLDARVDVYALGCVFYEALTGSVPYPRESPEATMRAHISDAPPSVLDGAPDVPMEFDTVVRRAMAKEPNQRFISAEAMRQAIDAAARGGASSRETGVVRRTASEPGSVESKTEVASEPPAPRALADNPVTSQSTAGTGEDPGQTKPGLPATTPAMTKAGPSEDARTGAPIRRRRNPRMLLAFAGLGLAVVVAAVLLVTSGGGRENPSTSTRSISVPAATKLPADLAWQAIDDAPSRRQYAASTAVDDKVWVFGGLVRRTSGTATKVYDPAEGMWRTGPGLPLALDHLMAVTYQGEAVVVGGFVPGENLAPEASDRVYVLRDGDYWKPLPPLHHPRAAGAAAVVGNKIVVVGGRTEDEKLVAQSEMFDGKRWKDVAPIPTPRDHLGAASDGRYLYAVGGRELSSAKNVPALERYDPVSNHWTELKSMPIASGSVGVAYAGGRVIAVGGENPTSASNAVQAYEIQKHAWSRLPNLPHARHGVAVTALGDDLLYAVGGAAEAGHVQSSQEAEVLAFK